MPQPDDAIIISIFAARVMGKMSCFSQDIFARRESARYNFGNRFKRLEIAATRSQGCRRRLYFQPAKTGFASFASEFDLPKNISRTRKAKGCAS